MREMQHHKKESWENPEENNTKGKDSGGSKRNPYYQSNKDGREHERDERNRSETRRLRQDQDQVLSAWETTQEARIQETSIRVRYGKLKDNLDGIKRGIREVREVHQAILPQKWGLVGTTFGPNLPEF